MFDDAFVVQLAEQLVSKLVPKLGQHGKTGIAPRLMTVEEAAQYIARSENAVRILVHRKELPAVHGGKRVHLDRRDLDMWIERNKY